MELWSESYRDNYEKALGLPWFTSYLFSYRIIVLEIVFLGWLKAHVVLYIYIHMFMHDYTDGYTSDIQPAWGYVPLGECLNITFAHLFVRVRYSSAILILVLVLLVESFFFLISPDFSWLNGYGSIWLYDQYLKHRLEMKNQGKSRRNTIPYD